MRRHRRVGHCAPAGLREIEPRAETNEGRPRRYLFGGYRACGYRGRSRKRRGRREIARRAATRLCASRARAEMHQPQANRQGQRVAKCRRKQIHASSKRTCGEIPLRHRKPSQPRPIILSDSFNVKKIFRNPAPNPLNLPMHAQNPPDQALPRSKSVRN